MTDKYSIPLMAWNLQGNMKNQQGLLIFPIYTAHQEDRPGSQHHYFLGTRPQLTFVAILSWLLPFLLQPPQYLNCYVQLSFLLASRLHVLKVSSVDLALYTTACWRQWLLRGEGIKPLTTAPKHFLVYGFTHSLDVCWHTAVAQLDNTHVYILSSRIYPVVKY